MTRDITCITGVAGEPGCYPLQQPGAREKFLEILLFYAGIYFCVLAAFAIMGNHYHALAQFEAFRILTRVELRRIAEQLYRDRWFKPYLFWRAAEWRRFNRRLFDVSEFMRNVESDYARWHNRQFGRKGQLWADRFKSNLLESARAVQAVALYIELNPLRARLGPPTRRVPVQLSPAATGRREATELAHAADASCGEAWPRAGGAAALRLPAAPGRDEDRERRRVLAGDHPPGRGRRLLGGHVSGESALHERRAGDGGRRADPGAAQGLVAQGIYRQVRSPVRFRLGSLSMLRGQRSNFIANLIALESPEATVLQQKILQRAAIGKRQFRAGAEKVGSRGTRLGFPSRAPQTSVPICAQLALSD